MPDFGFDGVSSSLAEFMSIFFPNFFFFIFFGIMYVFYTPAACQQSTKQHHTSAVVCPRCMCYCCGFLFNSWLLLLSDPAISRPAGLCGCVIHAATGTTTQIFHNVVI